MTDLILPSRELLLPKRKPVLAPKVAGFFTLTVHRPDGTSRQVAKFPNLITDSGLNRIGTAAAMNYCHVGAGSTTPAEANTALVSWLAATNTVQSDTNGAQGSAPYYGWFKRVYRFAAGVAAGNLAEVGIGWSSTSAAGLFSRALILDDEGDPTTITVLGDEVLDVGYELRIYPPLTDSTFDFELSGVEYECVMRAANVTNGSSWYAGAAISGVTAAPMQVFAYRSATLGAITAALSGTSLGNVNIYASTYVNNSKQAVFPVQFSLIEANHASGISGFLLSQANVLGQYQCTIDPPIPKDSSKILSFPLTIAWDRHTI